MPHRWRNGVLSACALLALGVVGEGCESKGCTSSFECTDDQLCVRAGGESYHCRAKCDGDGGCADASACAIVTSADCPTCDIVLRACVPNAPPGH